MRLLTALFGRARTSAPVGRRDFPPAALEAIAKVIAQGETRHNADIKLIIEVAPCQPVRSHGDQGRRNATRARANQLFAEYRIWDTENNSGVLLYLNLADRRVEIVADRDVNRALPTAEWHAVCRCITDGFKAGQFQESLLTGLHDLNTRLTQCYPALASRRDDLTAAPIVL